ncbi:hypothetical protein Tco_1108381 [Tanacetum coccineum]
MDSQSCPRGQFYKWEFLCRPFSKGPGKVKFLIVVIDYSTKWIGAKPVSSNRDTPFSLTYRTEAIILVEIGMLTSRTAEIDMVQNDEALEINLDLLEERREQTTIREARSKAKMDNITTLKSVTQASNQEILCTRTMIPTMQKIARRVV